MGEPGRSVALAWSPQAGPQAKFIQCPVFEAVYGGARGGGKTDANLGDWAIHAERYGENAKGLFVRRTRVALEPTIERAKQIFTPLGAQWHEQKSRFVWPNGAILYFRYLERDADADHYQGHDYTRLYIEELTQFPTDGPVNKLKATLRSATGVPTAFRASCNPGGPGHTWVKARYIDPGPWRIIKESFTSPFDGSTVELGRVFIPARLSDNPRLLLNDPLYVAKLQQSGSEQLVRAWLEGDWDVIEGAFFDRWSAARNVVRPFEIPANWLRFRSFDWGSAKPFSVGWWTICPDDGDYGDKFIPRGALVRYREWYGSTGKPNEGLKLTAENVAEGIKFREAKDTIAYGVADPSIFREDGGPSIGERMRRTGMHWKPADNARVPGNGAIGGWDQMRSRINGPRDDDGKPTGPAMLFVFETCRDFIRTVPVLQHDTNRPEDLDTDGEDHVADEARYACMSRPWIPPAAVKSRNPTDYGHGRRSEEAEDSWRTA
jgi:hypothetical protein